MPDAYEVYEGRYLAEGISTSAANGLFEQVGPVPANRVWTILKARLAPSVAETQYVWFSVVTRTSQVVPVTAPIQAALAPAVEQNYPLLREGMELKLFPGEYIRAYRAAATAGSTIAIYAQYIDSPLPIYEEYEPQVRRAQIKKRSTGQRSIGGGGGSSGGEGPEAGPPPGGPGESIPGY